MCVTYMAWYGILGYFNNKIDLAIFQEGEEGELRRLAEQKLVIC